jgi:hypothetical protein
MEIAMVLAAACGSTGWVYSIVGIHSWHLAHFGRQAQDEVWGDEPTALIGSQYNPRGVVTARAHGAGGSSRPAGLGHGGVERAGDVAPLSVRDKKNFLSFDPNEQWSQLRICIGHSGGQLLIG